MLPGVPSKRKEAEKSRGKSRATGKKQHEGKITREKSGESGGSGLCSLDGSNSLKKRALAIAISGRSDCYSVIRTHEARPDQPQDPDSTRSGCHSARHSGTSKAAGAPSLCSHLGSTTNARDFRSRVRSRPARKAIHLRFPFRQVSRSLASSSPIRSTVSTGKLATSCALASSLSIWSRRFCPALGRCCCR